MGLTEPQDAPCAAPPLGDTMHVDALAPDGPWRAHVRRLHRDRRCDHRHEVRDRADQCAERIRRELEALPMAALIAP
jgi:hypothetical protein